MTRLRFAAALAALLVATGCAAVSHETSGGGKPLDARTAGSRPDGYAWRLLERHCQQCHKLPDPGRHDRDQWERGLAEMRKKVNLTEADWDSLVALVPPGGEPPSP